MASSKSKKRGISALIADSSNVPEVTSKRACAVSAGYRIKQQCKKKAPRGIHARSARVVASQDPTLEPEDPMPTLEPEDPTLPENSLYNMLKTRPEVLHHGQDIISEYIKRNITFTEQKAIALNIFSVALSEGDGIVDASRTAAKFTGFNPDTIRKWAQVVFRDFFGSASNIKDVDVKALEAELMSNRGKHNVKSQYTN